MGKIRNLLARPVLWAASRFSSKPEREKIFAALSKLVESIITEPGKRGLVIPFEEHTGKFIIFSDQHKGARNGADDFKNAEKNYLSALDHYSSNDFYFINLGDSEELWENSIWKVKARNKLTFEAEKKFLQHNQHVKIFGNHDLYWDTSPWAYWHLKHIFGEKVKVYEAAVLKTLVRKQQAKVDMVDAGVTGDASPAGAAGTELTLFLTHGHQGDAQSDGNWFSKFFVAYIWAPLQSLLRINPNTPAYDAEKKTLHNSIMYDWVSTQKNMLLVTGHTHQPVFTSLTHLERLYKQLQFADHNKDEVKSREVRSEILKRESEFTAVALDYMSMKPSYFNTGCCCFSDGDITGIEIDEGYIRLIKWTLVDGMPARVLLEEISLADLVNAIS